MLVIGDSVGRDTFHSLRRAFADINFVMIHQSGCTPADVQHDRVACFPKLAELVALYDAHHQVDAVVLAFRYRPPDWLAVEKSLRDLPAIVPNVILVGVSPVFRKFVADFVNAHKGSDFPATIAMTDASMIHWDFSDLARDAKTMAGRYGVSFVHVDDDFCPGGSCLYFFDGDPMRPVFWDNWHLSPGGIAWYAGILAKEPLLRYKLRPAKVR